MSLAFPTTALKKPSGVTAIPSGLKRPVFGTLYGFDAQGGDSQFNIDIRDTHSNIIARSGDATGTIAFGTDTNDLYVYDGALWVYYFNSFSSTFSVSMDGADDYASATLGSQVFDGDFGISFWFNADDAPVYTSLLQLGTDAGYNDGWRLYRYSAGLNMALWKGQGGYSASLASAGSTTTGAWHHVAITRSGSSMVMYLNGSSIQTGTDSTAYTSTAFNVGFSTYPFNGFMDEVALWDSALSASNVTAIYNSGTPDNISSLSPVNWWRMGENDSGSGTNVTDQGSAGNNMTLNNGAGFSTTTP